MTREKEIKEFKRNMTDGSFCVSDEIVNDIIDETIEWADKHPQNPWISVEERLPEENQHVIIHTCRHNIYTTRYKAVVNGIRFSFGSGYVDYWMPIPPIEKGGLQ